MLTALARSITHHPWRYLVAWVLVVSAALLPALGVVGDGLFSRLASGQASVPGEARTGADLLAGAEPSGPTVLAQVDDVDPADPWCRARSARRWPTSARATTSPRPPHRSPPSPA